MSFARAAIQATSAASVTALLAAAAFSLLACGSAPARPEEEPEKPKLEAPTEGERLLAADRLAEAVEHYRKQTAANPRDPRVWHGLGASCYRSGDLECAETALVRSLELASKDAGVLSSLGLLRHRQGRHEEARALLERAIMLEPGHGPAHNNLALALLAAGDEKGARESFEAALAANPDDLVALENLGVMLLYRQGDAKAARPHLERRLRLMAAKETAPGPDDLRDAGLAALFSQDTEAALSWLTQGHEAAPDRADLSFHLGMAFVEAGELDRGVKLLQEAYERDASQALYASLLGRLLVRMRRCAPAVEVLGPAVGLDPDDGEAHMALGICQKAASEHEQAAVSFARACELGVSEGCSGGGRSPR